jgi:hypothetical protein
VPPAAPAGHRTAAASGVPANDISSRVYVRRSQKLHSRASALRLRAPGRPACARACSLIRCCWSMAPTAGPRSRPRRASPAWPKFDGRTYGAVVETLMRARNAWWRAAARGGTPRRSSRLLRRRRSPRCLPTGTRAGARRSRVAVEEQAAGKRRGDLVAELGLAAADLGLLTSVYLLAFATTISALMVDGAEQVGEIAAGPERRTEAGVDELPTVDPAWDGSADWPFRSSRMRNVLSCPQRSNEWEQAP